MISQFVMTLSLCATGIFFYLKESNDGSPPEGLDWLPVTSLAIFIAAFAGGTGPISYMIMGEILPRKAKGNEMNSVKCILLAAKNIPLLLCKIIGLGASVITGVKWITAFLTTRFFVNIMTIFNGESGGYWFFAAWCLLGLIYVIFCVPETKGKTLEEIQLKYAK